MAGRAGRRHRPWHELLLGRRQRRLRGRPAGGAAERRSLRPRRLAGAGDSRPDRGRGAGAGAARAARRGGRRTRHRPHPHAATAPQPEHWGPFTRLDRCRRHPHRRLLRPAGVRPDLPDATRRGPAPRSAADRPDDDARRGRRRHPGRQPLCRSLGTAAGPGLGDAAADRAARAAAGARPGGDASSPSPPIGFLGRRALRDHRGDRPGVPARAARPRLRDHAGPGDRARRPDRGGPRDCWPTPRASPPPCSSSPPSPSSPPAWPGRCPAKGPRPVPSQPSRFLPTPDAAALPSLLDRVERRDGGMGEPPG